MNILQVHMLSIAVVTAITCSLPGVFLVLRGVALMSDAISHAILFGIVIMFIFVQSLASPLLIVGATIAGLLTVVGTELLIATDQLKKDAAIGLVFPFLFSIAVILISTHTRSVHLDIDMVLLGELAFAPFHRLILYGVDCGPRALWTMGVLCIGNLLFICFLYKELRLGIFDKLYAQVAGFRPTLVYYALMTMVSVTAVGAFDIVGSIVVVALMVIPAATAFLCTYKLHHMLLIAVLVSSLAAIGGYLFAAVWDVSIAGSIASTSGLLFICVLVVQSKHRFLQ